MAKRILTILGIYNLFDEVVTQERTGLKKPNPEVLIQAANMLNVSIRDCISIGDLKDKDIDPATKIGMIGFLVKDPDDVCKFCLDLSLVEHRKK